MSAARGTDLRILLALAEGVDQIPGGHVTQMRELGNAMCKMGVDARWAADAKQDWRPDLVHGLDLPPSEVRAYRRIGGGVVISPVYWPRHLYGRPQRWKLARSQFARSLKDIASASHGLSAPRPERVSWLKRAYALELADHLLPNSHAEDRALHEDFQTSTPSTVIPNGVDGGIFRFAESKGRTGVIAAGRLEPHKNQLGLIKAIRGTGIPLTVVGDVHPHHPDYARACASAAGDNVTFVARQEPARLAELFGRARVHALPSWFETVGLSTLEAAATGATVVVGRYGYAYEYLQESARYCDPGSVRSIRSAVLEAYEAPLEPILAERIREQFSWERAAVATVEAYRTVLEATE